MAHPYHHSLSSVKNGATARPWFSPDSSLEEAGFEPLVPRVEDGIFETDSERGR